MTVKCPKCGSVLETPDSVIDGQHVFCLGCKTKSFFLRGALVPIKISPISSYCNTFKKFTDYSGIASRSEFWFFALLNSIIYILLSVLDSFIGLSGWLPLIFVIAILFPTISVSIRRMHDIGKSGAWIFIALIPFVGFIWWIVLACQPSKTNNNSYL